MCYIIVSLDSSLFILTFWWVPWQWLSKCKLLFFCPLIWFAEEIYNGTGNRVWKNLVLMWLMIWDETWLAGELQGFTDGLWRFLGLHSSMLACSFFFFEIKRGIIPKVQRECRPIYNSYSSIKWCKTIPKS